MDIWCYRVADTGGLGADNWRFLQENLETCLTLGPLLEPRLEESGLRQHFDCRAVVPRHQRQTRLVA